MAMLTRIKTACFLILGLALVLVAPQPIVGVLVLMVVVGAIEEMIAILFADGSDKVSIIKCKLPHLFKQRIAIEGIVIGCVQCALLITAAMWGVALQFAALLWATYVVGTVGYVTKANTLWKEISFLALLVCMITAAIGFLHWQKDNIWLLIAIITLTALSDSAGLVVGKLIGNKKVFPSISPNKTEFGTLAMLLTPGITMFAYCQWSGSDISLIFVLLGPLALLGDLWISRIKRLANIKDTGHLLPGHGGILDRIDSHILTLSTAYLWFG